PPHSTLPLFPYTTLFRSYFTSGRWSKNITGLLAGIGLLLLATALMLTPQNAEVLLLVARTRAYLVFLVASNALLLAAIAAFGIRSEEHTSELQSPYDLVC